MDIKFQKQKRIFNKINKIYINGSFTLEEACEKSGVCRKTYYNIKKKINGGEIKTDKDKKEKKKDKKEDKSSDTDSKKSKKKHNQKGGENIIKTDDNVDDNDTYSDLKQRIKKKFDEQKAIIDKSKKK